MNQMNNELASNLIELAKEKATEIGIKICIAVTDTGAHLSAFSRMDNAFTGSIDVAIGKARTSSLFPLPTETFGDLVRNEQLTGMELTNQGLVCFPGGLPIMSGEQQIGAIGISGGSAAQDVEIAEYALQKCEGLS